MKRTKRTLFGSLLLIPGAALAADVEVTTDITADTTWTADNEYILRKPIFVTGGAELTIEPGTVIYGTEDAGNGTFGSLIITRDAKIWAEGDSENPIVFTALEERDGIGGDASTLPLQPGFDASLWGGLILLGNAPINYYDGNVSQGEDEIEGFPSGSSEDNIKYGGNDPGDSSGALKYVSIRWGGYEFASNEEINGLTLGGVGSGTEIEYIEVFANSDDGVEFFGGTVNTKHVAVAFCWDESFDIDQGHQGYHQHWFAIQNADPSVGDKLGEWDGGNGTPVTEMPYTLTQIYNATLIGGGVGVNNGIELSDNFAGTLANSTVTDADVALGSQGTPQDGVGSPKPVFLNNTWGNFSSAGLVPQIGGGAAADPAGAENGAIAVDPMLRGISRDADGGLDPRPSSGSPLLTAPLASFPESAPAGFFDDVDYRGAFGETNWLEGWSYLSQAGYLGDLVNDVDVSADITADTTWTADNAYVLRKPIFVTNGAELTIEPGTVIYGTEDAGNGTFGSLVITRGSKIWAEGTYEQPIVFTALEERDGIAGDPETLPLDPTLDASLWGGLILLGNAPINYYDGNVSQGEDEIEGFPSGSSEDNIKYGGNDPGDSSGALKYVSIRWGGYEFASNEEINGLTLGGVGSGTEIEYIEVFANSDDGVEFFGGTVNTKRIAVAFCWDESFDIDQGHQGYHQYWFAIQNADPSVGDKLGEWDGGNGTPVTEEPYTLTEVYNATLIGGGAGVNNGIELSDNFAGTLANSTVTDADVALGSQGTPQDGVGSPKPFFKYNTWGAFSDAGLVPVIGNGAAASPDGFGNGEIGVDPGFTGLSRDADGGLDPRPALNSSLRNAALAEFPAGAPAGFYENVDYRGAFGDKNWLWGWSYLYQAGYLGQVSQQQIADAQGREDQGGGSFGDADGDGISDEVEQANADLGFDPQVNNGAPDAIFGDLSSSDQLLNIGYAQATIDSGSGDAILTLELEGSTTLDDWTSEQEINVGLPQGTKFYRFDEE